MGLGGYCHSMTRIRSGQFTSEMLFFPGWWGQGKQLVLDGDPGSWAVGQGLGGKTGSSVEQWFWELVPSGRAFRLAELLAAALKTNSPWKR